MSKENLIHVAIIAKDKISLLKSEITAKGGRIVSWQELGARDEDALILESLGILYSGMCEDLVWAQDILYDVTVFEFESIKKAQRTLRLLKTPLVCWETHLHRRAELISQELPKLKKLELTSFDVIHREFGVWAMIHANMGFYARTSREKWPLGKYEFLETKLPPSRAYLKLWETFYRIGRWPEAMDSIVELGASPGGWTWVFIHQLKCFVHAIDRAPLRQDLMSASRLKFSKMDAFSFLPDSKQKMDWIFSDLICEPQRLLAFVKVWVAEGSVKTIVATIKFKGNTDVETMNQFVQIQGSKILHLYNNKHEVTWIYYRPC